MCSGRCDCDYGFGGAGGPNMGIPGISGCGFGWWRPNISGKKSGDAVGYREARRGTTCTTGTTARHSTSPFEKAFVTKPVAVPLPVLTSHFPVAPIGTVGAIGGPAAQPVNNIANPIAIKTKAVLYFRMCDELPLYLVTLAKANALQLKCFLSHMYKKSRPGNKKPDAHSCTGLLEMVTRNQNEE